MAFAIAIAVGVASAPVLTSRLLLREARLERVAVQGAKALSPRGITRAAGISGGMPLSTFDPEAIRTSLSTEPWIASARTLLLPTGTLIISVVEKKAVARWLGDPSGPVELIDQQGERFPGTKERAGPLPLVRGTDETMTVLPASAIEILREIDRHASLSVDANRLTLRLPERPTAIAGISSDDPASAPSDDHFGYILELGEAGPRALLGQQFLGQRVARLAALLEDSEVMRQGARWIDLRYADRAVLRTEPVSG